MKIRTSLFVFALAVLLPVAVCSAIAAVAYERQQRRAVERTGVERARALAGSVDRELAAAVMTLKALTTARTLELDDLPAFQQDVRRALATQSGWADIVLSSPAGHALITTVVPGETRPAPTREPAAFWAIARSGTPEVGPLVPDARTGRFAFLVSVPVIRHGVVQYILTAAIDATVMREVLARQHIPGVWVGTIVDPRRTIVARTQDPAELTGRPLPPELARLFSGDPESWGIARTVEGGLAYTAVSRSLTTGWGASLAIPRAAVDAPLRPWLWTIATGAAVLLAACAALSVLVGRRIAGPITALAKTAKEVERQGDVPTTAVESGPAEVREVAGALVKVAERQRQTEAERADLLIASEAARAASEIGRQAAARLAAIVEGANDAIASKTLAGIITSWNPAAERLFGWAAAEAIGQPITLIIPPERHDEERDILARISRGERIVHFETERVAKDGHRLAISLTISPVRAPSGEIVGASKIARDVSEQKRIEVERAELLGREQAARAQAESASRAKDEFLAMLGHELRNPLNVVVAAVEVLHLAGHDEATAAKARDAIQRQIRHLTELVDDLLDVARVTAGKITLSPRPVDLGALVARSIQGLRGAGRL